MSTVKEILAPSPTAAPSLVAGNRRLSQLFIVVTWLICGVITGIIASSKGRTGGGWFLIGCLLGIFGLILIACLPSLQHQSGNSVQSQLVADYRPTKSCPDCGETVLQVANVCKHCGLRFGAPKPAA
ncbi:hypothetical protein HFO97_27050 [Rhizobium leguminosarum]|uniref:hypothetical protein n=1 Tax=Rhizobium leguminosarum TaxID=384 RepID=UPI001C9670ED|nr:hypothetical protein [Rhizobium leguminosarum]MBY5363542.1 hypothetical protein [Rhizobium leguminosarum]